jgi:hypothetical protein
VKSPRQANWTPTCQPQIHKPDPYYVEEEEEFVDEEFQEYDFIDEEFKTKGVEDEDLLQELVDWGIPPVYDDDVNEEEPIEESLASDLEEEYKNMSCILCLAASNLKKMTNWKRKSPRIASPMKMANWKMKSPWMASSMKSTHWKMEIPRMTSSIVKKMTSPIIKRLSMLIFLVLKIF